MQVADFFLEELTNGLLVLVPIGGQWDWERILPRGVRHDQGL